MKLYTGMRGKNSGLVDLIAILPSDILMAEVGCYAGESTLMFMQSGKIKVLYAIDPWSNKWDGDIPAGKEKSYRHMYANMAWAEQSFDFRLKGYDVVKYKNTLKEVIDKLPLLDFFYIDGDHRYEYVKNDTTLAMKKIVRGGIIAGHDYNHVNNKGVIRAVNEVLGKPDRVFRDTSWLKYIH